MFESFKKRQAEKTEEALKERDRALDDLHRAAEELVEAEKRTANAIGDYHERMRNVEERRNNPEIRNAEHELAVERLKEKILKSTRERAKGNTDSV